MSNALVIITFQICFIEMLELFKCLHDHVRIYTDNTADQWKSYTGIISSGVSQEFQWEDQIFRPPKINENMPF